VDAVPLSWIDVNSPAISARLFQGTQALRAKMSLLPMCDRLSPWNKGA
jgi:hypothetical protein